MVGYNVQPAVDTEHHLIVAHEVTNQVVDRGQLPKMAAKAKEALGFETIEAIADAGYYRGGDLIACRFETKEGDLTMFVYWCTACRACPLKSQCTTGRERRVRRWEHESLVEAMTARMEAISAMAIRRETAEHPFSTIKAWMGRPTSCARASRRCAPRWACMCSPIT